MIDPDQIMNAESGAMETKFTPVPDGEYIAMIPQGGIGFKEVTIEGEPRQVMEVQWEISKDDPRYEEAAKETGMRNPRVRQSVFLDVVTDENGKVLSFATGKGMNVQLGRLRDALGQNNPTKKWTPRHLEGAAARIKVEHRVHEGDTFAQVAKKDGVTKL